MNDCILRGKGGGRGGGREGKGKGLKTNQCDQTVSILLGILFRYLWGSIPEVCHTNVLSIGIFITLWSR